MVVASANHEDSHLHSSRCENRKSYLRLSCFLFKFHTSNVLRGNTYSSGGLKLESGFYPKRL